MLNFGADPTGNQDVSAAMNMASATVHWVIIPPGKYLLDGKATVTLENVLIDCEGTTANANGNYGASGATFLLTSKTTQPFVIGNGVRMRNCNFYWPDQRGAGAVPIPYPPLFTETKGRQLANFDLIDDRIINAYDVLDQASFNDPFGNISMTDTYGYAIRYWFQLANVPETITIKGMSADWNLFQNVANAAPGYNLVKWTATHGAFLHVFGNGDGSTTASSVQVAGVIYDGVIFGYNKFVWVDRTGFMEEAVFHGIYDAVPRVIEVDNGGCMSDVQIDGIYYSYQWNPPLGGLGLGSDNAPEFSITTPRGGFAGCTVGRIDIGGSSATAQGEILDLAGNYITTVRLHLNGNGIYARTTAPGTYYFARVDAPNAAFAAIGNYIQPRAPGRDARGFDVESCLQCTIGNNQFNGVYDPISIRGSGVVVSGTGNMSIGSPVNSSAVVGSGTFAHLLLVGNYWDRVSAPGVTHCGAHPVLKPGGTDSIGEIVIGSGTVSTCILNFASLFADSPKCFVTTSVGYAWIGAVSGASVTFNMQGTKGGGLLWYQCQP